MTSSSSLYPFNSPYSYLPIHYQNVTSASSNQSPLHSYLNDLTEFFQHPVSQLLIKKHMVDALVDGYWESKLASNSETRKKRNQQIFSMKYCFNFVHVFVRHVELPDAWRNSFETACPPLHIQITSYHDIESWEGYQHWADEVKQWIKTIKKLKLNRWPNSTEQEEYEKQKHQIQKDAESDNIIQSSSTETVNPTTDSASAAKKDHEIAALLPLLLNCTTTPHTDIRYLIDAGSGKGYMSHLLAIQGGKHMCGLEGKESNAIEAL